MPSTVVVTFLIFICQIVVCRASGGGKCCQPEPEWKLVFKGVAGIGGNLYDLWTSDEGLNEDVAGARALTNEFQGHYKNHLMDHWEAIGVTEVKVAVYSDGQEKASLIFNGIGSDKENWFSIDRLRASPWGDLMDAKLENGKDGQYFSVAGDNGINRHFFINNNYGGCGNDAGWLVVVDDGSTVCNWSEYADKPYVMYASDSKVTYESGNAQFADFIAVFIKHRFEFFESSHHWEMVFKAVSGSGGNVLDLWNSDGGRNEDNRVVKNINTQFRDHYKNSKIDDWSSLGVKEVKVAVYDQCKEVMNMVFNGEGSDKNNWFSKDRLTSTSYTDLDTNSATNYFSIEGDDGISRHFFVNANYGGCGNDAGWLVVVDTENVACDWSEMETRPYFLCGSAGQKVTYQSGASDVTTGTEFAVYIKT